MRPSGWFFAGVAAGAAATHLLFNQPSLQYETGYDIEDEANSTRPWRETEHFGKSSARVDAVMKKAEETVSGEAVPEHLREP
jgi:hypothetical protein